MNRPLRLALAACFCSGLCACGSSSSTPNTVTAKDAGDSGSDTTTIVTDKDAGDSGSASDGPTDTTGTADAPNPKGTADPTLLPVASGQAPAAQAPGGSLAAGASYPDPVTGVRVYKVTDPSIDNTGGVSSYASGGPYISQPWMSGGKTYYTLIYLGQSDGGMYFVDFCYADGTLSNYRDAPAGGVLKWAWSYNPATPRIGYYLSGSVLHRYDTQTMANADQGHFPKDLSAIYGSLYWLSVDKNDQWFSVSAANDSRGGAWDAVNDVVRGPYAPSGYDEPHLDKNGDYLYVVHDRDFGGYLQSSYDVVRLSDGASISPAIAQSHPATLEGYVVQSDPTGTHTVEEYYNPSTFSEGNPDVTVFYATDELHSGHRAGQWLTEFGNGSGLDQWYVFSNYQGGSTKLNLGIAFVHPAGGPIYLLANSYSIGGATDYWAQPHATVSPDGKLVMWSSNMGVAGGRLDLYVAEVPTK